MMKSSILIIYTGGTIGMKNDAETGALVPFDFSAIYDEFPSLKRLNVDIDVLTMDPVIDSSNVTPANWAALAELIRDNYARYDGFVVLHGTDTMSYTASAMSFMLENLAKPVVFTGSQIPIGVLRTDGRENLITAIEIAGAHIGGRPPPSAAPKRGAPSAPTIIRRWRRSGSTSPTISRPSCIRRRFRPSCASPRGWPTESRWSNSFRDWAKTSSGPCSRPPD